MVEVEGEDGVAAAVPDLGVYREVEDDVAFDGLVGIDAGFAQEERGGLRRGELSESGKAGVEVFELGVLDGAGGGLERSIAGDEGGGDVFEEERKAEAIGEADGDQEIEVILGRVVAHDDGVGLEDGMGGIEVDAGDGDVRGGVRGEAEEEEARETKDDEGKDDRNGEVAAFRLGEGKIGHALRIAVRWSDLADAGRCVGAMAGSYSRDEGTAGGTCLCTFGKMLRRLEMEERGVEACSRLRLTAPARQSSRRRCQQQRRG